MFGELVPSTVSALSPLDRSSSCWACYIWLCTIIDCRKRGQRWLQVALSSQVRVVLLWVSRQWGYVQVHTLGLCSLILSMLAGCNHSGACCKVYTCEFQVKWIDFAKRHETVAEGFGCFDNVSSKEASSWPRIHVGHKYKSETMTLPRTHTILNSFRYWPAGATTLPERWGNHDKERENAMRKNKQSNNNSHSKQLLPLHIE